MPADPAAVPPPEWARDMALSAFMDGHFDMAAIDSVARLLASVRERTLREAAGVSAPFPGVVHSIANPCDACQIAYTTGSLDAASALHNAILSLIAQPPKPERSDGSEAEGREEA